MAPPAATKDWPAEDLHPAALLTCLKLEHTIRIPYQHPKLCPFMHQAELTLRLWSISVKGI